MHSSYDPLPVIHHAPKTSKPRRATMMRNLESLRLIKQLPINIVKSKTSASPASASNACVDEVTRSPRVVSAPHRANATIPPAISTFVEWSCGRRYSRAIHFSDSTILRRSQSVGACIIRTTAASSEPRSVVDRAISRAHDTNKRPTLT